MKVNLNWNSSIKICGKIIGPIAVLLIYIVMAVSFSSHTPIYNPYSSGAGGELHYEKGKVVSIDEQVINPSGFSELYIGRQIVNVLIESGQYEGQTFQVNNALNYDTNFVLHKGQDIVVSINTSTGDKSLVNVYMFAPSRVVPLLVLIGIYWSNVFSRRLAWFSFYTRDCIYFDHSFIHIYSTTFPWSICGFCNYFTCYNNFLRDPIFSWRF